MKTALFLAGVLLPASVAAQTVAHSFTELERHGTLKAGDKILITYAAERGGSYTEAKARLEKLTDTSITVKLDSPPAGESSLKVRSEGRKHLIEIPQDLVTRIELPERGVPKWVGGLIGAGAGTGASFAALLLCINANEHGNGCGLSDGDFYLLTTGLIGGGAAAGAFVVNPKDREAVFLRDGVSDDRITVSLSPILSRERKGVRLSLTW